MAAVAMPPIERPSSASSRRGGGTPREGSQPPTARGAPSYPHLQFDSNGRIPQEKTAERDRFRNKLIDVGQRFVGFDKVIESDTVQRRQKETARMNAVQETLAKLERALNCEIKRRVEANRKVQGLTEQWANQMLERLQSSILVRVDKLNASTESLTYRCTALEKGISQFRGELPSKLQVDTAALVKEITGLRKAMELDSQTRIQRDTALLRRLSEIESAESMTFEQATATLKHSFDQLKAEVEGINRSETVSDTRTEKFRAFILEEIAGMKNTLAVSAQAREHTDEEIVQAMNKYTDALHKGLHSANKR